MIHFRVNTYSPYYQSQFATEKPGTPKHIIYKKYLENRKLVNSMKTVKDTMAEVLEEPKTLMYGNIAVIGPFSRIERELRSQFQALKIDDGSWMLTTIALQKNSEFHQVFNYYILKQYEHGLRRKNFQRLWSDYLRNENFGINEAYPLALNNVMFPFIWLLGGIFTTLTIASMEFIILKLKRREIEYGIPSPIGKLLSPGYMSNNSFNLD